MKRDLTFIAEAYATMYSEPKQTSISQSDLMLELVSRITAGFTFMYPLHNPIQENTIQYIAQRWSEGKLDKNLMEQVLARARTQNAKAVNTFLAYLGEGIYDNVTKAFVHKNILPNIVEG